VPSVLSVYKNHGNSQRAKLNQHFSASKTGSLLITDKVYCQAASPTYQMEKN
jgi:hypothetical protein